MIHQLDINGMDKVQIAIKRLKTFEPKEGYYIAFAGGKDSCVVKKLADMAGVKYDAHYSVTTVDHPKLVQFIKREYPDVIFEKARYKDGTQITMWNLIPRKKMPPTRLVRYCCAELKETGGDGRFTVTGVRWEESERRKNNQGLVTIYNANKKLKENKNFRLTKAGGVVLTNDNTESRKMIDTCYQRRKTVLNPIIDWTEREVWEFIFEYNVPYCELYDEGFRRLGCIGCPMSTKQKQDLEMYPKIKQAYLNAFGRMLKEIRSSGKTATWKTPEEVYEWWVSNSAKEDLEQYTVFEEEEQ